jgi:hypothetical protein
MKNSSSLARSVALILVSLAAGLMIVDARGSQSDQNKQALDEINKMIAGRGDEPAERVFKNIEILKGKNASRLPGMMSALTGLLGLDCLHCHMPREWEKETPAKQTARKHFDLLKVVNDQLENQTNSVTCWTCHRGKPQPEAPPQSFRPTEEMRKQADQDRRPAEEVYKNIRSLRGVQAGRWMMIMNMFTRSLGVDCNYCHVEDKFELDDKPPKQIARRMLRIVGTIAREIYKGPTSINCYTCHRGQTRPVSLPSETPAKKQ